MRNHGSLLTAAALALLIGIALTTASPALANTFACCLPDGSCQDTLLMTCDELNGVALVGRLCAESLCNPAAPVLSRFGLLAAAAGLAAVAFLALSQRARA